MRWCVPHLWKTISEQLEKSHCLARCSAILAYSFRHILQNMHAMGGVLIASEGRQQFLRACDAPGSESESIGRILEC